jgi:putative ABC transport system ATP-binding protein
MATERIVVEAVGLTRTHEADGIVVRSLDHVSLTVNQGEIVGVMGPSGSGKTTLLHLLGGLDRPDEGSVRLAGVDWETLSNDERARFRRRACGYVLQGQALLPQATAAENVEVPLLLAGVRPEERPDLVARELERVGLSTHAAKLPDQLSGGEQQRVAIARALVMRPAVVLADEPTGSLDSATSMAVTRLLVAAANEHGAAVILVTHDPMVASVAGRIIRLESGRVAEDGSAEGGSG